MELPDCQNCGAELSEVSSQNQFAKCGHCGTLHNVSRWFADRLPPEIVELKQPLSPYEPPGLSKRLGAAGFGILFFMGGGTALLVAWTPSIVGYNASSGIWLLRVIFIITMLAGLTLGAKAMIGRGQRGR